MQSDHKNKKKELRNFSLSRIEKIHPYKMLLYLVMLGSSFVFLFLVVAYHISQPYTYSFEYFRIPRAFIISTIILLVSSFQIHKAIDYYKRDDTKGIEFSYGISILMGLIFLCIQYIGWDQLNSNGIIISGLTTDHYIFVIFGIHTLYILLGLSFACYQFYNLFKMPKDPVYSLILFTNPFERMKIDLLVQYWHFINVVWMGLFLYFLFAF